jgi:hypothetical protein
VDTWVTGYNCDRPHQSLDMGYPAERFAPSQHHPAAAQDLLPLRLPANLQPAGAPQATAITTTAPPTPVESVQAVDAVREDADSPVAAVVYQGGPVEFDRVVPASGNLAVRANSSGSDPPTPGSRSPFGPIAM